MASVAGIVSLFLQIYEFLILIRVLLSWINVNPTRPGIDHPAVRVLNRVTDPVLAPLRRLIPPIGGTIDVSPVVALILLEILRRVLSGFLLRL
jgi:YggT family protein